ncbi:MAG: hypothetical protein ACP5UQ_10710 [Anaerolineae bacterium]
MAGMPPTERLRVNLVGMFVSLIGFGVLVVLVTIALAAQDPLWFWSRFEERPVRVIVYSGGRQIVFEPGRRGYDELAEAVRASLAQGVVRSSGIGLSAASLEDAYRLYVTVEAFFARPVKLHAAFNTGWPTQMLFPITGRHSDQPVVFLGRNGQYMANGPVLKTVEPIRSVLRTLGLLP